MNENEINQNQYGVDQINSIEGLAAIRKRPGMYIGPLNSPIQLIWETIDNSIDEFMVGCGNEVNLTILSNNTIIIEDHGRGIPVGPHKEWKNKDNTPLDTLTGVLTKLHAGGKFNTKDSAYKYSGGLHGIGVKATNALSDLFEVKVKRDDKIYQQKFSKGEPITDIEITGKCEKNDTGTQIIYHPDKEIFKITLESPCKDIQKRLNELTSLNMGLKINYKNEITDVEKEFYYPDGIKGYVKRLIENENSLYDEPIYIKGEYKLSDNEFILVEIAFIHVDNEQPNEVIKTFANNINTHEGGYHLQGFRNAYKKQLNKYGTDNKLIEEPVELRYLLDGIYCIINVKIPEAEFESQTKNKLLNFEAETAVEDIMDKAFIQMFKNKENKNIFETLVTRALRVKEAEEAARKARALTRKVGKVSRTALPGKLADCANKNGYSEIFLCLHGDTKVKLLNGTNPTIEELTKKNQFDSFWIYSIDENGEFYPALAKNPRVTQYVNKLLKIELSDGSIVKCTPEHKFLDRETMQWIEAKDLLIGSSLYHLTLKYSEKNYELIYNKGNKTYNYTHTLVNKIINNYDYENLHYTIEDKINFPVTHHCDYNKQNNTPENLKWMLRRDHFNFHHEQGSIIGVKNLLKYVQSEEGRKKSSETMKKYNKTEQHKIDMQKAWNDPETRKIMSEGVYYRTEEGINCQKKAVSQGWKDGKYKNATFATNGYCGSQKHHDDLVKRMNTPEAKAKCAVQIIVSNKNPEHNKKRSRSKIAKVINKCYNQGLDFTKENYNLIRLENTNGYSSTPIYNNILNHFNSYEEAWEYGKNYNFTIVNITEIYYEEPIPVYCLTVESNLHAFVIENGLITHNCEGDSASGTCKNGRFREFQAILPIFGKLLNTEKSSELKMIDSIKIKIIIAALQAGVGNTFDINKVRYDKIIITSDHDLDGYHISALLITFFYNYMKSLITEGRIYLACPPLYKVVKGKNSFYIKDDQELQEYKKKHGSNFELLRFKGLGEMNSEQLKETVMNPETRTLKKITVEDAEKAVQTLNVWMGDESQLRRDFIEANANLINLE